MVETDAQIAAAKRWRKKNPQLSVCLTLSEYAAFGRIAGSRSLSVAELARKVVRDLINTDPAAYHPDDRRTAASRQAMAAIGKGLTPEEKAVLRAPAPANGMKRQQPILEHNGVVNPVHLPAKKIAVDSKIESTVAATPVSEFRYFGQNKGSFFVQTRNPCNIPREPVDKPHFFYHPESDSYVTIPESELPAFRNSQDGALCVEVEAIPVVGGSDNVETPQSPISTVIPEESVKPASTWSYRKFKESQKKS